MPALEKEKNTVPAKATHPLTSPKAASKFSINAALSAPEESAAEAEQKETPAERPAKHFTETDLKSEWHAFLERLRQKDVVRYNAVSNFQLHKKDEKTIEVVYPSASALTEFESMRAEFFNHFSHKVDNFSFSVVYRNDTKLKKEVVTKRKIFDKFAEINPLLNDLNDLMKFDLS